MVRSPKGRRLAYYGRPGRERVNRNSATETKNFVSIIKKGYEDQVFSFVETFKEDN